MAWVGGFNLHAGVRVAHDEPDAADVAGAPSRPCLGLRRGGENRKGRKGRKGATGLGGQALRRLVLGDGIDELHSIVCTGGETALREALGIALNQHGLIDGLDDARRAATWASEEGHGEPVAYLPWRVALYPRS